MKYLFYLLVIGTPLFYLERTIYPYIFAKHPFFQIVVELIFFVWLCIAIQDKRYRPRPTLFLWAVLVFMSAMVLTSLLGVDLHESFWSNQGRMTGVVFFLHLGALFLVARSSFKHLPWRSLAIASLATASVVSIAALIQLAHPNLLLIEPVNGRPGATFGNPTFLAGYLVFNIFLALYAAFVSGREKKQGNVWLSIGLAVLLTSALIVTQTRGDILGFGVGALVLLVCYAIVPPGTSGRWGSVKIYRILLAALIFFSAIFWFTRGASIWQGVPGFSRFRDVSIKSAIEPRLVAYRAAWEGFKEKPLLGWGWENFNIVFNKNYDPSVLKYGYLETRFDKPHNLYLEYLVSGGIILFLAFIGLLVAMAYQLWRTRSFPEVPFILAALGAYLVRSFFVFDTLGILLMLWLLFAYQDGRYEEMVQAQSTSNSNPSKAIPSQDKVLLSVFVLISMAPIYFINIQSMRVGALQYDAFKGFSQNPAKAIADFKQAIAIWSPYRWNVKRDYAAKVSESYFNNPGTVPDSEVALAVSAFEEVAKEHPMDAYNHYTLIDIYNQVSGINPDYLKRAEYEAERAIELSPKRQEIYFSLAKTKSLEGDNDAALVILTDAIALAPDVPDGHFYYGIIAYANHDTMKGYSEIKRARELGYQWRGPYEPLVSANFFVESGHIDEAIGFYNDSLSIKDEPETRLKLGIAYYLQGNYGVARDEFIKVLQTMDIRTSPDFERVLPMLQALGLTG